MGLCIATGVGTLPLNKIGVDSMFISEASESDVVIKNVNSEQEFYNAIREINQDIPSNSYLDTYGDSIQKKKYKIVLEKDIVINTHNMPVYDEGIDSRGRHIYTSGIDIGGKHKEYKEITIIGNGHSITLEGGKSYNTNNIGSAYGIASFKCNSTLNLGDENDTGLTIYRGEGNLEPLFYLRSTMNMYSNTTIDGKNLSAYDSAVLVSDYGILNMYGGKIINNRNLDKKRKYNVPGGGGIHITAGAFNMYGGEIYNNYSRNGGGIYGEEGAINIYSGTIRNNHAVYGGGIYGGGVIHSGIIQNNVASQGGGIYSYGFNMYGGEVKNNRASHEGFFEDEDIPLAGDGVFSSDFTLRGGSIINNAGSHAGIYNVGTLIIESKEDNDEVNYKINKKRSNPIIVKNNGENQQMNIVSADATYSIISRLINGSDIGISIYDNNKFKGVEYNINVSEAISDMYSIESMMRGQYKAEHKQVFAKLAGGVNYSDVSKYLSADEKGYEIKDDKYNILIVNTNPKSNTETSTSGDTKNNGGTSIKDTSVNSGGTNSKPTKEFISSKPFGENAIPEKIDASSVNALRTSGNDRISTSLLISKKYFKSSDNVILASAKDFPDALSASVLSKNLKAPIILVGSDGIDSKTSDEIKRLGAKNVVIIGGENSVPEKVKNQILSSSNNIAVKRISGSDRYDTSSKIAEEIFKLTGKKDKVVIASGENFPDSLSIGGYASKNDYPILLVKKESVPTNVKNVIGKNKLKDFVVVGGEGSISGNASNEVLEIVKNSGSSNPDAKRIAGENRYETSLKLALSMSRSDKAFIVSGEKFADALVIGGIAGLNDQNILLTKNSDNTYLDSAHEGIRNFINKSIKYVDVVGGESSLSASSVIKILKK